MSILAISLAASVLVIGVAQGMLMNKIFKPPQGSPSDFLATSRAHDGPLVVCVGDSLTHGNLGGAWVRTMQEQFKGQLHIVNAGFNGDTSWNLLQKLDDEALKLKPSVVVLLGGTNDAMGTLKPETNGKLYTSGLAYGLSAQKKANPNLPTLELYTMQMGEILRLLKESGFVKHRAVLSIPMLGENLDSEANMMVNKFNAAIRSLATEHQATFLDLNQGLWKVAMDSSLTQGGNGKDWEGLDKGGLELVLAPLLVYGLGWSWNEVGDWLGYSVLTDGVHLNDRGGEVAAHLVAPYLEKFVEPSIKP